uniref:BY PROTMAP: gi/647394382/emb/CDR35611.1/ RHTO0S01e03224g1_1 [Rhodosporidium toruloides] n=1 Tax=Rhodotorula toruloides TaxID=5286 RepID=A0A0K3CLE3_RHOTO
MEQSDGSPQPADGPLAPLIARLAPFVATAKSKKGKATTLPPLDEPLANFHEWLTKLQETDSLSPELAKDATAFLRYQCFAYTVLSATIAAAVEGKEDEASALKNKAVAMLEIARDLIECLANTLLGLPGGLETRAGEEGEADKKVYGDLLHALLDGLCDHLKPHNAYQKKPAPEDLAYRGLFGEILLPSLSKLVFPDPAGLPSASGRAISDGAKGGKIRAEIKYASFAIVYESMSKHPLNKERIRRIFPPDHIASILQGGYDAHLSTAAFECAFRMAPSRRSPAERADFVKQLFDESRFGKSAKELRASFDRINGDDLEDRMPIMLTRISNDSIKRQPFRAFSLKYNGRPLLDSKREESSHNVVPANESSLRAVADGKAYEPAIVWFSTDILAAEVPEPTEIVKMRRADDPRPAPEKAVELEDSSEDSVRMVIDLGAVERVHVQDLGKDPNVAKVTILISADSPARFGSIPHPSSALHVGTSLESLPESQVGSKSKSMHKLEMIFPAGNDNLNILKKTLAARKERYPKLGDELQRFPIRVGVSPPNKAPEKPLNAKSAAKPASKGASKPAAKPASKAEETTKNVAFAPTPATSTAAAASGSIVKRAPRKSSEAGPVVAQPVEPVADGTTEQVESAQRGDAASKGKAKLEKVREENVDHLAASQEAARRRAAEVAGLAELDKASSVATSEKTRSTESEMRGVEEDALAGQEFGGGFEDGNQAIMDVDGVPAGEGGEADRAEDAVKHKTPANTRRLEGDAGRAPGRRRKEVQSAEDEGQDDVTPSQQRQNAKSGDLASSDLSEPATEASDIDEVEQPVKKKKVVQPAKKGRGGAGTDGDKKAKKAEADADTQSLASGRPRRAAASKAVANLRGQKRASTPLEEEEEESGGEDEIEVEPEKPAVKKGKKVKKASPPPAKRRKTSPTPSATAEESGEETDYDDFPGGDVASTLEEKKATVRPSHKYGKEVKSVVRSMGGKRKAGKPVAKAKAAPAKAKKRQEEEWATDEDAAKASAQKRSTSPVLKPKRQGPKKHVVEKGGTDLEDERNAEPVRPAKQDKRIADDIPPPRDLTQGELERAKELEPRARRASRSPEEKSPAKPIRSFSALVGREDGAPGHQRLGEHIIEGVGRLTAEPEEEAEEENVFEAGPFPDELDDFSAFATGKQVQVAVDTVRQQIRSSLSPFVDPARDETFVERAVAETSTSGAQVVVATAAQAVVIAQKRSSPAPATAQQAGKDVNLSPTGADDSGVHFQLPQDLGDEAAEGEMATKTRSVVQQAVAPNHAKYDAGARKQQTAASGRRDVQPMLVEKPSQARVPLGTVRPFAPSSDTRRHRSLSPGAVGAHATPAVPPKAAASARPYIAAAAVHQTHVASPAFPFSEQRAQSPQAGPSTMQAPSKQAGGFFAEREEQATPAAAAESAKASTSRAQQQIVGASVPREDFGRPIGRKEGLVGGTASTSSKKPVSAPPAFASGFGGASTSRKAPKPKQHVKGRLGGNGGFGQQQRRPKNGKAREKAPLLPPISPSLSSEADFGAEAKSDWQQGEYEMDAFLTKFFRAAVVEKQAEQRRQREAHHELSRQRLMGKLSAYVNKAHNDALIIANNIQARLNDAEQPDSFASNLRKYAKHANEVNKIVWEETRRELEKIAEKEKAEEEAKKGK